MTAVTSGAAGALRGTLRVPGDKSISHRALMLAASTAGETVVHGLLEADDVLATAAAIEALGATIERGGDGGPWRIHGRGVGGLARARQRPRPGQFRHRGEIADRPAGRSAIQLDAHRRRIFGRPAHGAGDRPARADGRPVHLPVGRAAADDRSRHRPAASDRRSPGRRVGPGEIRNSSRRAHRSGKRPPLSNGAGPGIIRNACCDRSAPNVAIEETADGTAATITGQPELEPAEIRVPGDISSAAFPLVAACHHRGL